MRRYVYLPQKWQKFEKYFQNNCNWNSETGREARSHVPINSPEYLRWAGRLDRDESVRAQRWEVAQRSPQRRYTGG